MATTMTAATVPVHASPVPNPEVPERPKRRRFSIEYKLAILAETDAAPMGQIAAILRREGLYSSHLAMFRQQRDAGRLGAGAPTKRGPKANPFASENAKLRRENERLRHELAKARFVIEVEKKVAKLLEIPDSADEES
jgi:transposase